MTCNGCVASVKKHLESFPQVQQADVILEEKSATVTLSENISTELFKENLPSKFTISESINIMTPAFSGEPPKTKLQQLKPLILILSYITISSILMNLGHWNSGDFMLDFMGLFFIVFSFFKMLDLKGFPDSFRMYDPLAKAVPVYGWLYPFIETILGLLFLIRYEIHVALSITLVILSITTYGVIKTLMSKKEIQCACLGTALKLPMTEATLIENTIMLVMVILMLSNYVL